MNKSAIQKFAIWARTELIAQVSQKAYQYGITEEGYGEAGAVTVGGRALTSDEAKQRRELVAQIRQKGYTQVMEEVAYTWFNRFIALRFMEVNNYLPSHIRVFSDSTGAFKPEILSDALHLDLPGLDKDKVATYIESNQTEDLYRYLLLTQCNALNEAQPRMFEKMGGYTELLFPNNILKSDSVLGRMVTDIPEEDWTDQVQIIGWLYQYYNSELKDDTFALLKKNVKITKERIPSATQLFTPDWIVRYMVENSLGRLWIEGHPDDELKSGWKYYLDEAEQEPEVQKQLDAIHAEYTTLKPQDIKVIDPCMGSGHILVYAFDVLIQIYKKYGVSERDAAQSILQNNLYGLDIDDRAAQLAYFAVMMKARQYDRRIFSRGIQPHVYAIVESNGLDNATIDYFTNHDPKLKKDFGTLVDELQDAKEYGSILNITPVDFAALNARVEEVRKDISLYRENVLNTVLPLIKVAEVMAQKYNVVVTNPPYMEISSGTKKLVDYVNKHFIGGKTDMFAVFIEKASDYAMKSGFIGMITQPSLTSLVSFERLRRKLFTEKSFCNLVQMGRGIFGIDFGSVSFVYRNSHIKAYIARYFKLYERTFQFIQIEDIRDIFLNAKIDGNYRFDFNKYDTSTGIPQQSCDTGNQIAYTAKQDMFMLVPGIPFAYTMSNEMISAYTKGLLGDIFTTREGMATAGNDVFLRMWYEVAFNKIYFNCANSTLAYESHMKWFPYNKGGDYRKWYGNNDYVVDWENDGQRIRNNVDKRTGRIRSHNYNGEYAFRHGLTWSSISAGDISIRWSDDGFLFDSKGAKGFSSNDEAMYAILGFLNSTTAMRYLKVISPTMDFKVGDIIQLPLEKKIFESEELICLVKDNIHLLRKDWDSKETSWDFKICAAIEGTSTKNAVKSFVNDMKSARERLRQNEQKINTIISTIYNLKKTRCDVPDEKLSIVEYSYEEVVKTIISYAVGCMFGRYSLDVEGLAYAGGQWDASKYSTIVPDKDNIIPICDDDYFDDDMTGRFIKWVEAVYGSDTLEENLKFIADALGGKGTPREVIRNYFLNDFYADHCKTYQKRPIYWLFDSGKKNGFKALIYMHRYQSDLLARMRTDYVHEQQERYRTQLAHLADALERASGSERVKLTKQQKKLQDQSLEIQKYEEKIHHLADQNISIDLDDGVKHNYALFADVLAKIK